MHSYPACFRAFFFLFLLLLAIPGLGQGQRFLALDKPGKVKRFRYFVGDEIKFKLKGDKVLYTDQLQDITDTSIVVRNTHVPLRDIQSVVRYSESRLLKQAIYILPRAGILYFLADTFNPIFYGGEVEVSRSGIIVGSSLVAGGLALKVFRKRTYRINNFRSLKVLQTF